MHPGDWLPPEAGDSSRLAKMPNPRWVLGWGFLQHRLMRKLEEDGLGF